MTPSHSLRICAASVCAATFFLAGAAISRAEQAAPPAPTEASPSSAITTAEDAYEYLTGLRRPLSEAEAERVEALIRAARAENSADMRWPIALAILSRSRTIADGESLTREAIQNAANSADAWYAFAVYLNSTGSSQPTMEQVERTRAAVKALENALVLEPAHAGALEMAVEYYATAPASAGGDREKAIMLSDRMMADEAIRWRGAELRALICMVGRDWDGFDRWSEQAILWATTPAAERDARMQQALIHLSFNQNYEKALALSEPFAQPGLPEADRFSFVVGQAAYRLGRYDLAAEHYRRVIEAGDPPPNALLDLSDCLRREGDLEGAIAMIDRFLERFPAHPRERDVRLTRSALDTQLQQRKQAEQPPPAE